MKSLKILTTLVILGSLTLFVACSSEDSADVNQDRIFTDYEVFYNENTDETRIMASFRFGENLLGTPLRLEDPAGVTFNAVEMPYRGTFLAHVLEEVGQVSSGTFIYTNADGESFTNELPAFNEIDFPFPLTAISVSNAFELRWDGPPLGPNEDVSLFVGGLDTEDGFFFTDEEGATSITLSRDNLQALSLGENTFYLERAIRLDAQETTDAGGRIRVRYRTANKTINLTE